MTSARNHDRARRPALPHRVGAKRSQARVR